MLDETDLLQALRRHWEYSGKDEDVSHEIYHDDAVLEFPQSGERFEGAPRVLQTRPRHLPSSRVVVAPGTRTADEADGVRDPHSPVLYQTAMFNLTPIGASSKGHGGSARITAQPRWISTRGSGPGRGGLGRPRRIRQSVGRSLSSSSRSASEGRIPR